MPSLISPSQSAFVPGRLITNNVLVVHKMMHHLSTKRQGKVGSMVIKLDMSKIYDRVDWDFLKIVMLTMGLDVKLVQLIMSCLSLSILINGELHGHRLGQGDFLLPYLFFFCIKGLIALLQDVERKKKIRELKICGGEPSIKIPIFC